MKTKILTWLKQADTYLSGQDICDQFGVSRTAVWKAIKQLKEEGYDIEAIPNKGYYLKSSPDILTFSEVKSVLTTKWIGEELYYYEEIDSTNTKAKQLAEEGAPSGTLVIANTQSQGKGRRGRSWDSPAGAGVFMTLLLKPNMKPSHASMLTLVMALSVVKACNEITSDSCLIKWPNDIVYNGKKICGILTEMSAEMDYINHIVIGIGINANTEVFKEELEEKATSILLQGGIKVERAKLINRIMTQFEYEYDIFFRHQSLKEQIDEYNRLLVNRNRQVVVHESLKEVLGIALGINEKGELLVRKEDGQVDAIYAGEVSVRGINGYV